MSTPQTSSETGHVAYTDAEWLVGRWHNLGYAVRDDVLTVAVLAPNNNGPDGPPRISLRLCPVKLRDLRRRSPPPAIPTPTDPIVEAVCGLKVPPGQYHVFRFEENHALPDL